MYIIYAEAEVKSLEIGRKPTLEAAQQEGERLISQFEQDYEDWESGDMEEPLNSSTGMFEGCDVYILCPDNTMLGYEEDEWVQF